MKIAAAAIQMPSEVGHLAANLDRADGLLRQARDSGAALAVLPEMFNTGYGLIPDYSEHAEPIDGPTLDHLADRSREWKMGIAAGFVERDGHDLFDAMALILPDGARHVYRKRNLVFWERFRFRPGSHGRVVPTPWGRVGLAICADMIYSNVWESYRGSIDIALVASAWPDFACQDRDRPHWIFGKIGPLCGAIPDRVAKDLGIPVVFANQCGPTQTVIPLWGTWLREKINDRFAGMSCVSDGFHSGPVLAGRDESVILSEITIHAHRGPRAWHSTSRSASEASSSASAFSG